MEAINHAFTYSAFDSHRGWRSSLAREYVHTDGRIDQIDFERSGGYPRGRVALERVWTTRFPPERPNWSWMSFQNPLEIDHCRRFGLVCDARSEPSIGSTQIWEFSDCVGDIFNTALQKKRCSRHQVERIQIRASKSECNRTHSLSCAELQMRSGENQSPQDLTCK